MYLIDDFSLRKVHNKSVRGSGALFLWWTKHCKRVPDREMLDGNQRRYCSNDPLVDLHDLVLDTYSLARGSSSKNIKPTDRWRIWTRRLRIWLSMTSMARRKEPKREIEISATWLRCPRDTFPRNRKLARFSRRRASRPRCRAYRGLPRWLACLDECYTCSSSTVLPIESQLN